MDSKKESLQLSDNLQFFKIFRAFYIAVQPRSLIIAFLAITVICLSGWFMDLSRTVVVTKDSQGKIINSELEVYITSPDQVREYIDKFKDKNTVIEKKEEPGRRRRIAGKESLSKKRKVADQPTMISGRSGVYVTLWHFAARKFNNAVNALFAFNLTEVTVNIVDCFKAVGWSIKYHFLYCLVFFAIKLGVISFAGACLCRIAALQIAKGEKTGLTEAFRFGTKKFKDFFLAPLIPLAVIMFAGFFIFILGVLGNIPWFGELIIGCSIWFTLLAGVFIAVITVGAVVGFNLMFPAIAYEGSDCFDAISRSFSYIYSKPWQMIFYTVTAAAYGSACYVFVRFSAFLLIAISRFFLQLGVWVNNDQAVNKLDAIWPCPSFINLLGASAATPENWVQSFSAWLIYLSLLAVVGVVVSFIISFYFSANTIIYSLLRKTVDGTALEEIYSDLDHENIDMSISADGSEKKVPDEESNG